jgi:glycerol uptake facilitator-like aquaporin
MVLIGLGVPWTGADFARDALVLAACAAPSAPISKEVWERRSGRMAARMLDEVTSIDEIAGLAVLGAVAILYRPADPTMQWVLPPSAWLLVTLGLGGVLGILTYVLLRGARNAGERLAYLLGAVALSAGVAGYLALSVPVVCALAGALLANLPLRDLQGLKKLMIDVERPIYLIFLLVVGASWRPGEWQGWVLAPAFVLARVAGKRLGAIWAKRVGPPELPSARLLALALAPQSPISIVVIVSAATLYQGNAPERVRWAINAVIIGGVLTEVVVRILERMRRQNGADMTPLPSPSMVDAIEREAVGTAMLATAAAAVATAPAAVPPASAQPAPPQLAIEETHR